jgi:hypothetical protein
MAAIPSSSRPALRVIAPSASPEEAAAVVAALERFMRATAPAQQPAETPIDPWRRAALVEGTARMDPGDEADPWICLKPARL